MRIGIATINDNNNYGNRLQNYATQEMIKTLYNSTIEVCTIKNHAVINKKTNIFEYCLRIIKFVQIKLKKRAKGKRQIYFDEFNNKIIWTKKTFNWLEISKYFSFDYCVTGSDQVWNPHYRLSAFDLLEFINPEKRIAFSASISAEEIPEDKILFAKEHFSKFKAISVREEKGKEIIETLTGRKDVEVLVDPTMLLTSDEWDKVAKKPEQLKCDKYILNYFLGNLSKEREDAIKKIAEENNCEIINLLDKDGEFYATGPSEFLYLEKNAFLICTDSFHSSVFAILYNRPFVIFDREQQGMNNMNSRIETLLSKFKLKNREYNGQNITSENLHHDYTEAYKILEQEREKSKNFLKKALDIKD